MAETVRTLQCSAKVNQVRDLDLATCAASHSAARYTTFLAFRVPIKQKQTKKLI